MMKCLQCTYSTDDKKKEFCPYDGSDLVVAEESFNGSELVEYDDE
jgi:hypothetical protein